MTLTDIEPSGLSRVRLTEREAVVARRLASGLTFDVGQGEKVVEMLPLAAFDPGKLVILATRNGVVKKTELDAFSSIRSSGIIAVNIDEGDALVGARVTDGKSDLALCTREGRVARFKEEKVRTVGRTARGVKGITLRKGDEVVAMEVLDRDLPATLLTVCERGFGKRTPSADYPTKGRGSQGVITIKTGERNGKVVGVTVVRDSDELMLITNNGRIIRIRVSGIPTRGRNTMGVRLIRVAEGESVVAMETLSDVIEPGTGEGVEAGAAVDGGAAGAEDATAQIEELEGLETEDELGGGAEDDDEDDAEDDAE